MKDFDLCECTHWREVHKHHRRGSDCGICGPEVCKKFKKAKKRRESTDG